MAGSLAMSVGGCATSYQLGSFFGFGDSRPKAAPASDDVTTGTIRPTTVSTLAPTLPPEPDLAYARAAANSVLSREGKDASVPWENPQTGARGTVTAIASAYTQNGFTCRDFLASYVKDGTEAWMQGEACRIQDDQWHVRILRPWNRT